MKSFTPREKDVIELLLEGKSNAEMAKLLKVEIITIKQHVRNIRLKIGAKNRTHAAIMLLKNNYNTKQEPIKVTWTEVEQ